MRAGGEVLRPMNSAGAAGEPKKLVFGASGFLGSHVTRHLVDAGHDVRVMLRPTSDTRAIDDLPVERRYGDLFDDASTCSPMPCRTASIAARSSRSFSLPNRSFTAVKPPSSTRECASAASVVTSCRQRPLLL